MKGIFVDENRLYENMEPVRNINISVSKGERIGILGDGAETVLAVLAGNVAVSKGAVHIHKRPNAELFLQQGFQKEFSGTENIEIAALRHGIPAGEILQKEKEIILFSGLNQNTLNKAVKKYSKQQLFRLAFSITTKMCDNDIFLLDERGYISDNAFDERKERCLQNLLQAGKTIILNIDRIEHIKGCTRLILMRNGEVCFDSASQHLHKAYRKSTDAVKTKSRDVITKERV